MVSNKVTIKDIAERANVSVGTVSKVINGDSSVKERNRAAVEEAVKALNYNVNKVARSLRHKPLRLGILLPSEFKEYYRPMLMGIRIAVESLSDFKVSALYERYANFNDDKTVTDCLDRFEESGVDGIILGPSHIGAHSDRIARLSRKQIPVVVMMSDMAGTGRIACISIDAKMSGSIAADLSGLLLKEKETVAVLIGNHDMTEHQMKAESFIHKAAEWNIGVEGVYETYESSETAYRLTEELLEKKPQLRLIYVATANSVSVCKCIQDHGFEKKVHVIATDVLQELRPYVEENMVVAILDQHLQQQGEAAVNVLYKYLTEGILYREEARLEPSLLLKSNIMSQMDA